MRGALMASAFQFGEMAGAPLANPVAIAVAILVLVLLLTDTPYKTYFDGAQFVHFLLGPATVALAIPLYAQLARLRSMLVPALVALVAGSLTAAPYRQWPSPGRSARRASPRCRWRPSR